MLNCGSVGKHWIPSQITLKHVHSVHIVHFLTSISDSSKLHVGSDVSSCGSGHGATSCWTWFPAACSTAWGETVRCDPVCLVTSWRWAQLPHWFSDSDSGSNSVCFLVSMPQAPSFGSDVNKRMSVFLRRLADALERNDQELRSTAMKRDFISHRLPPYLLEQADLEPSESLWPAVWCTADVCDDDRFISSLSAGKLPSLEDTVCLRFKEHLLLTVEPSQDNTVRVSYTFI